MQKNLFCGTENESAIGHMNELSALSNLFSDDINKCTYSSNLFAIPKYIRLAFIYPSN
jgi:hypothetical protein